MAQKKYMVHVEDDHICTQFEIKASSAAEARLKAREKFILAFYNIRKVKATVTNTENC
ncbi:MAG: hypothetical protein IJ504_00960 [Bacteroidales bacterium]|nr:hypothetical protein [Bacteroidales bacterium]